MIKDITCINCPLGCLLNINLEEESKVNVSGALCKKGDLYAKAEISNPTRMVTSTIPVKKSGLKMVSVKTQAPIPKDKIFECLKSLINVEAQAPVKIGDIIIKNVCGTGVDIIATRNAELKRRKF